MESKQIDGLAIHEDFLTPAEETKLLQSIDKEPWNTKLSRRTQHYGHAYDYASKATTEALPIPGWCAFAMDRLVERGILAALPDQMIVNEYVPGQGIYAHVDDPRSFADGIVSLSLGSPVIMDFVRGNEKDKKGEKQEVALPRRSVLSLSGPARYEWRHGIASRKSDHGVKRTRRVSLTFRTMNTQRSKKAKVQ
jgi:alkylated DNA repair dioxygenase AlkB